MRCPIESHESAELLLEYCARKLDPETAAILERHIGVCPHCRDFRDAQSAVWEALGRWEAIPVSPGFDRRLYRKIEEAGRLGWWARLARSLSPVRMRPAVPVAAAVCLVVMASLILRPPSRIQNPAPRPGQQITLEQVEQVERSLEDLDMLRQINLVSAKGESAQPL